MKRRTIKIQDPTTGLTYEYNLNVDVDWLTENEKEDLRESMAQRIEELIRFRAGAAATPEHGMTPALLLTTQEE